MQPDCSGCENVTKFLESNGIHYEERDISLDGAAYAEFHRLGLPATPVTVIGEYRVMGFDRKALAHALGLPERK